MMKKLKKEKINQKLSLQLNVIKPFYEEDYAAEELIKRRQKVLKGSKVIMRLKQRFKIDRNGVSTKK